MLQPVFDKYGVGFMPVHGFSGATAVHDVAEDNDGRLLIRSLRWRLRSERHVHVGGRPVPTGLKGTVATM